MKRSIQLRATPFLLSMLAIMSCATILFLFNPAEHSFYPFCFFYRTTGLLCPGCGALRALHQLLHGQVAAAVRFNALLVFFLPFAACFSGWFAIRKLKHQSAAFAIGSSWLWISLGVLLAFGILRNLPFAQKFWLAP